MYENLVIFLKISMAIDLHEESRFIAEGILTNSMLRPLSFVLDSILSMFMGGICIKITYFVGLSRCFYQGVRLILQWPKFTIKNGRFSRLWTTSSSPNLGPSAKNLVYTYTKVAIWSISVVVHTCRIIYITSLAQNLKNIKICLDCPPGAVIDYLEGQNRTNPSDRGLGKLI